MAKAKKLKSGNWNVTVYDYTDDEGKRHYQSFTAETRAQCAQLAKEFELNKALRSTAPSGDPTVGEAIDKYIAQSQMLSPTSLQFYKALRKTGFQALMKVKVSKLTDDYCQQAINKESMRVSERTGKRISAKTVKEEWGLIATAVKAVNGKVFNVRLPKRHKKVKQYPEPETVLDAIMGSEIELPCLLAMWLSFSMSEIRGLMCSDVQDGYITISQVVVDVDSKPVVKSNAKVETRLRRHHLPPYLLTLIENTATYQKYIQNGEDSFLIELNRNMIAHRWQSICKKHNLNLTFHDLRHMNASVMLLLGVPEKYAMERGGWKTPHVMKSVYQHTFTKERQAVDAKIDGYFSALLERYAKQNAKQEPQSLEK